MAQLMPYREINVPITIEIAFSPLLPFFKVSHKELPNETGKIAIKILVARMLLPQVNANKSKDMKHIPQLIFFIDIIIYF